MCLLINNISEDARVADKPITVYKILREEEDGIYKTPLQDTTCEIGKTVKARHKFDEYQPANIYTGEVGEEGVHAYKSLFAARHSDVPSSYTFLNRSFYITEWEIPAGAKYWEGIHISCMEIAATEMKFVKIVEQWKVQKNYLLHPFFIRRNIDIEQLATHYFTDEGEIKPIEEGQHIDVWRLAWVINDLKKLVPETITKDGKDYEFTIKEIKGLDDIPWFSIYYECLNLSQAIICNFASPALDYGYIYAEMIHMLIKQGFLKPENLKKKVNFEIED